MPLKGYKQTKEHRENCSKARSGEKNHMWGKYGEKNPRGMLGKKHSTATRRKMSEAQRGEKNHLWKGGVSAVHHLLRNSAKYNEWRSAVFLRDGFTCQRCGDKTSGNFHAHHKKSLGKLMQEAKNYLPLFSKYDACLLYAPLWDIANGITVCKKCHKKLHKKRR